jgi:flagellar basal-body rod protein FlgF
MINSVNSAIQVAASRMVGELSERLRATTENLTNSGVSGYRKCSVTQPRFDRFLDSKIEPCKISTDFSQGDLRATSNPLDFAIRGNAYFEVTRDGSTFCTRNGQFQVESNGNLTTYTGFSLMGKNGPISLPSGISPEEMTVADDGTISARGQTLGQIKLVAFENPQTLVRTGTTLFGTSPETRTTEPVDVTVTNRMLESGNANAYEEMAELIQLTRSFEMNQRIIKSRDAIESQMIRTLV